MFQLTPLPYAYTALAPTISAETVEYHYDKHHRGYIEKLNALLADEGIEANSLHDLVLHASGQLYNQAAQAWNHDFYWQGMGPAGGDPDEVLVEGLERRFGALATFQRTFEEAALAHFGSGWAWLVCDARDELQIWCGHDADNPLRHGFVPLLVCDLWEHAYYLDYRHKRGDYLHGFWSVVDWLAVARRHARRGLAAP